MKPDPQTTSVAKRQEVIDQFYWSHGPCCAGCDAWQSYNSLVGDCTRSAPVSADERWAMTGIESITLSSGAGHVVTRRDHKCGGFSDTFDWSSLSLVYQHRVGVRQ